MKRCIVLFIGSILAACLSTPSVSLQATLPSPRVTTETATPNPIPTETLTPSATPTVEELIFPYTIEGLRQHEYQSGDIQIRSTLDKNDSFTTYLINYPSDGLTISGVMQIPAGAGPFPVIVLNHGFFSRGVYRSGDGTDRAAAFLAKHGYITLASDYRSWGDSGIGNSFFYSGLVIDVINLLNAVPSIREADPNRIGMWGHSMGGGVTMKVLTVDSRVKAAVLYSPVSADQVDVINRWGIGCFGDIARGEQIIGCNSSDIIPETVPFDLQRAYRLAASDVTTLKNVSPIHYLDAIHIPIQIHFGTEDGKVLSGTPPEWSVKLTQALRDAGKDVELVRYEGEQHSFIGQPWFNFMERTLKFFDKNVKNASL
jgi:dipeptidyl aminopeptidase/acylaminoacyl peptidase